MQLIAGRDRRWWAVVLALVLVGAVAGAVALAASAEPSSSPDVPTAPESSSATASPTPGAEPSSGPTGTPTPGSLEVVPAGEKRTRAPVPFEATASFGSDLSLRVTQLEDVAGVAHGPGEIAGPAVRLTFALDNDGDEPVSLESVVVAVTYGGARTPAVTLSGPGQKPYGGTLEPGDTAEARYVFAIPVEERDRVQAVVSYAGSAPAVSFEGSVR